MTDDERFDIFMKGVASGRSHERSAPETVSIFKEILKINDKHLENDLAKEQDCKKWLQKIFWAVVVLNFLIISLIGNLT